MELLYFLICFTKAIFLPIPESVTVFAGSVAFGPFKGFIIGFSGIISGVMTMYLISKFSGAPHIRRFIKTEQLNRFSKYVKKNEILVTGLLFILPIFPDGVICVGAEVTGISFGTFITIAILSKLITCFTLAYSVQITNIIPITKMQLLVIQVFILLSITFINYLANSLGSQLLHREKY